MASNPDQKRIEYGSALRSTAFWLCISEFAWSSWYPFYRQSCLALLTAIAWHKWSLRSQIRLAIWKLLNFESPNFSTIYFTHLGQKFDKKSIKVEKSEIWLWNTWFDIFPVEIFNDCLISQPSVDGFLKTRCDSLLVGSQQSRRGLTIGEKWMERYKNDHYFKSEFPITLIIGTLLPQIGLQCIF